MSIKMRKKDKITYNLLGGKMFYLELKRVYIREFSLMDVYDVFEYSSNKNVGPNAGWPVHKNIEETKAVLVSLINKKETFAIVNKINNKVIGSIGVYKDEKRNNPYGCMIGYVLNESYWGKGIMSEVLSGFMYYLFNNTNIALLSIYHFPNNFRSKRVIEKSGFKYEGVLRKATLLFDGTIQDNVCYSLTKEEYLKDKQFLNS